LSRHRRCGLDQKPGQTPMPCWRSALPRPAGGGAACGQGVLLGVGLGGNVVSLSVRHLRGGRRGVRVVIGVLAKDVW